MDQGRFKNKFKNERSQLNILGENPEPAPSQQMQRQDSLVDDVVKPDPRGHSITLEEALQRRQMSKRVDRKSKLLAMLNDGAAHY